MNRHQAAGKVFKQFRCFGACGQVTLEVRLMTLNRSRGRVNPVVMAELLSEVVVDQFVMLARMERSLRQLLDQS